MNYPLNNINSSILRCLRIDIQTQSKDISAYTCEQTSQRNRDKCICLKIENLDNIYYVYKLIYKTYVYMPKNRKLR